MNHLNAEYQILGSSRAIRGVVETAQLFAPYDFGVLITGETGTGKDLVARAIHGYSPRKDNRFVPLNCGGIPEELVESELFGHEKGSFTGAYEAKRGIFEVANSGTLFLDEVGNMSAVAQASVLTAIEYGSFMRLGGTQEIKTDARVLAATNKELRGSPGFREDLYYRLSSGRITIPPLRERKEDIESIALFYLKALNARYSKQKRLDADALKALKNYEFPGNVRELLNILEHSFATSRGDVIEAYNITERIDAERLTRQLNVESSVTWHRAENTKAREDILVAALRKTNGNIKEAARIIQVPRQSVYVFLEKSGHTTESFCREHGIK